MAFESGIYTDVTADEAVDGMDGFNFASMSAGFEPRDRQATTQASLLHTVRTSWPTSGDPLEHPDTCTYVVEAGRMYLARGRSTGKVHNGRPGNQLTEIAVTGDAADFVPYRPAQLYAATSWNLATTPQKTTEPWRTPLSIDPEFEAGALQEMVRGDVWAQEVLPQLVEAIGQVGASLGNPMTKLMLVHSDINVVMKWIALATLMLDTDAAMHVQFRALVDDPFRDIRGGIQVIGISPEFSNHQPPTGMVIDLGQRSSAGITVSETAATFAGWFLDRDVNEAISAIETARSWTPTLGAKQATNASALINFGDEHLSAETAWNAAIAMAQGLPTVGQTELLELYSDEVADAVACYGPRTDQEFDIAAKAFASVLSNGLDALATRLLLPTLEALAATPACTGAWAGTARMVNRGLAWCDASEQQAAARTVVELLDKADALATADLLALCRVLEVPLTHEQVAAGLPRLRDHWLTNLPWGDSQWKVWPDGEHVRDAVIAEIVGKLRAGDPAIMTALTSGQLGTLAQDSTDQALHAWVSAAALAQMAPEQRGSGIRGSKLGHEGRAVAALALKEVGVLDFPEVHRAWLDAYGLSPDTEAAIATELDWFVETEALAGREDRKLAIAVLPVVDQVAKTTGSDDWAVRAQKVRDKAEAPTTSQKAGKAVGKMSKGLRTALQGKDDAALDGTDSQAAAPPEVDPNPGSGNQA